MSSMITIPNLPTMDTLDKKKEDTFLQNEKKRKDLDDCENDTCICIFVRRNSSFLFTQFFVSVMTNKLYSLLFINCTRNFNSTTVLIHTHKLQHNNAILLMVLLYSVHFVYWYYFQRFSCFDDVQWQLPNNFEMKLQISDHYDDQSSIPAVFFPMQKIFHFFFH